MHPLAKVHIYYNLQKVSLKSILNFLLKKIQEFEYLFSKNKMGLADVWYAAVSAETLSFFAWHKAMFLSCIFAGVYMVSAHKYKVPFIPFMSLGCIILILIKK